MKIFQMTLAEFLSHYPFFSELLPLSVDVQQPYIVRFSDDFSFFEIGYASDDWQLVV